MTPLKSTSAQAPMTVCMIVIYDAVKQRVISQCKQSERFKGNLIEPLTLKNDPSKEKQLSEEELLKKTMERYFHRTDEIFINEIKKGRKEYPAIDGITFYVYFIDVRKLGNISITGKLSYVKVSDIVRERKLHVRGTGNSEISTVFKFAIDDLLVADVFLKKSKAA